LGSVAASRGARKCSSSSDTDSQPAKNKAARYGAEIIWEGKKTIPLTRKEKTEISLIKRNDIGIKDLSYFHRGVYDIMSKGGTPIFTNHDNIRTQKDQENIALWRDLEREYFNPAGKSVGTIHDKKVIFVRTIDPQYDASKNLDECIKMPYFSTSFF
jgi:hypothetical protein